MYLSEYRRRMRILLAVYVHLYGKLIYNHFFTSAPSLSEPNTDHLHLLSPSSSFSLRQEDGQDRLNLCSSPSSSSSSFYALPVVCHSSTRSDRNDKREEADEEEVEKEDERAWEACECLALRLRRIGKRLFYQNLLLSLGDNVFSLARFFELIWR